MSAFDLAASLEKARRRLPSTPRTSRRRPRADRGTLRLDPRIVAFVHAAVGGQDRPQLALVLRGLHAQCRRIGLEPPSRATFYKLLAVLPMRTYRVAELPDAVRHALYNLASARDVPAHQLAFYCFNYGDLAAMSFAAGLPWLALYQALRLPGHRARSRGLLEAAAHARGIR